MRYLLFGTGEYYKRYRKWFEYEDILALLDNSVEKQNTYIDGIKVLPPEEGIGLPYDRVVILSFFVKEMKHQLLLLGVPEQKIFHFFDMHQLISPCMKMKSIQLYKNPERNICSDDQKKRNILLLSQDLELTGPAIALHQAAVFIKKAGYHVLFASMIDGPLKEKIINDGISVVVDVNLQVETMMEVKWIENFKVILCNTVNFHIFLMKRDINIPIIWWLHDPPFFYEGIRKENLEKIDFTNMMVFSVGPFPEKAIKEYLPQIYVRRLLYGVSDARKQNIKDKPYAENKNKKICLVTIGYINSIKGQDILIKAMQSIPKKQREKCVLYFVGQNTSPLAKHLIEETNSMPEIKFTGVLSRDRVNEVLENADVLICPSREDAMPTVCGEAMMHGVPCLISDAVGTTEYIQDGINGLIFQSENWEMLSEKILWCIDNKKKLPAIGQEARKVYETYFSKEIFEKNLISIINTCVGV